MNSALTQSPVGNLVSAPGFFSATGVHPDLEAFYQQNGYLVVEEAFDPDAVDTLLAETLRLCRNAGGALHGIPEAGPEEPDADILKRVLCIHFPHKVSEPIREVLGHPAIASVLTRVIGPNVKCMQSMLFVKAAGKPGQAWHQDEDYIPTRDRSLTGAWIALDDATVENGCLWVIPGSHRPGILWDQTWHGDRRFDCSLESHGFPYPEETAVPVEVRRGSVVFFNGYLLHRSLPNRAQAGFRRALVNHYMSAESFLPWRKPADGVPTAKADDRDIVMIAGIDPYAHKGLQEIFPPHVRPSGEGGCLDGTKTPRPYNRYDGCPVG